MVSKKSWEKFKRDVEGLTKTGVEKESWGKRLNNKDQNDSYSRKRRTSIPTSNIFEAVGKVHDDDIKGFSSSDEDQPKTICEPIKSFSSTSKRALCHSAPLKKRKRFKRYDTPDVKETTTTVTICRRKTFDSLRNKQLDAGLNTPKPISSNFENSFTEVSPQLLPLYSANSSLSPANAKPEVFKERRNANEDIVWSESDSEHEDVSHDHATESPWSTSQDTKIPFSSQKQHFNELKVDKKPVGDIDEFDSDNEEHEQHFENSGDKESVPSISPNTPTPTSPKIQAECEAGPPLDSSKKRKQKYLRTGLAERLRKLILRENSEKSFWFHKLRQRKEANEDNDQQLSQTDGTVTLRVVSAGLDHSVYVATCDVISQDVISQRQLPDRVMILLDNETRIQLEFKTKSSYLRIYSPWKIFDLPTSCLPVLLCITHCEVISSLPSSLHTLSNRNAEESTFSSSKQVDESTITKVARTRLFPLACDVNTGEKCLSNEDANDEQLNHGGNELRKKTLEDISPDFSSSLLDVLGLQGQCLKRKIDFTARIQRVYWQDVHTRSVTLNSTSSLVTTIIEQSKDLKKGNTMSLCLLVQDSAGFCSEIRVSSNVLLKRTEWQELLCTAEGSVMSFRGLCLVEHRKRKRRPALFGFIDSLSDTVIHEEERATEQLFNHGTAKQTLCFNFSTNESTVLQRLSEDQATDCVPYYPSSYLRLNDLRTSSAPERKRLKFYGQLLHVIYNRDRCNGTKHLRLFISCVFVANESSRGDVLALSEETVSDSVQVQYSSRRNLDWDESDLSVGQLLCMQDLMIERGNPSVLVADDFSKFQVLIPQSTFSTRSGTTAFNVDDLCRKTTSVAMVDEKYSQLRRISRTILPELNAEMESDRLVTFEGVVIDVDQVNAFCWFTCNECGSDDISEIQDNSLYICNSCALDIRCPVTNTHLEVYLKSLSSPELRIKVKLLQSTISRLLPASEGNSNEGYDVRCVLNKHLGPMSCYVLAKHDNAAQENADAPQISFKLEELNDKSWTH